MILLIHTLQIMTHTKPQRILCRNYELVIKSKSHHDFVIEFKDEIRNFLIKMLNFGGK